MNTSVLPLPELLAPAGDLSCLQAAVRAGADAVYFGLSDFNARRNAANFTEDDLPAAFDLCRTFGVRLHLTLNTLLYDRELPKALRLVERLQTSFQPDAYIIQDPGLAREIKKRFPEAVLHASTQMMIHSPGAAELLHSIGFSRAVLARELTRNEIDSCVASGIETEIFLHGALCVCQSGGCLMSGMLGGRSGNRGECAYPCRLAYAGKNDHPLSLKDLSLARDLPEVLSLGVSSLKIEGRMKPPAYVETVTRVFRTLLDERRAATDDEMARLAAVFSRSGFTDGYFTAHVGPAMFGVRTERDKQTSRELSLPASPPRCLPIAMEASFFPGKAAALTLRAKDVSVTVTGDVPEVPQNQPATESDLASRLAKLGNSPFEAASVRVSCGDVFVVASAVNALRRKGCDALLAALRAANAPKPSAFPDILPSSAGNPISNPSLSDGLICRFEGNHASSDCFAAAKRLEFPLWKPFLWREAAKRYSAVISLVLPRFSPAGTEAEIKTLLSEASAAGITQLTLPSPFFRSLAAGFTLHADYSCACVNTPSLAFLRDVGFTSVLLSPEAGNLPASVLPLERIVYGRVPLMHTRTCILRNIAGHCLDRPDAPDSNCTGILVDRLGASFPLLASFRHSNTLYNSVPTWLLDKPPASVSPVLFFTDEAESVQREILTAFARKAPPSGKFTRN